MQNLSGAIRSIVRMSRHGMLLALTLLGACATTQFTQTPARQGRLIYERHCIACHQIRAEGDEFRAIPDLAGQNHVYLTRQLEHFDLDERHGAEMHWALRRFAFDRVEDRDALVVYLSSLSPTRRPKASASTRNSVGEGLYRERCLRCHGSEATGMPEGEIPSIRDQHESYLRNRLRGLVHHEDLAIDSAMTRVVAPLSDNQIAALATYLAAL